jgi:hypothetical protein
MEIMCYVFWFLVVLHENKNLPSRSPQLWFISIFFPRDGLSWFPVGCSLFLLNIICLSLLQNNNAQSWNVFVNVKWSVEDIGSLPSILKCFHVMFLMSSVQYSEMPLLQAYAMITLTKVHFLHSSKLLLFFQTCRIIVGSDRNDIPHMLLNDFLLSWTFVLTLLSDELM